MHKDLKFITNNYNTLDGFKIYIARKDLHSNNEKEKLYEKLPKMFFEDAKNLLEKHMDQWRSHKLLQTIFLYQTEITTLVAKWNLEYPIYDSIIQYDFLHRTLDARKFLSFISKNMNPSDMTSLSFFIKHRIAISNLAVGINLMTTEMLDVVNFKQYALRTWLPIFSNTQGVELRIKDTVLYKTTDRHEEIISMTTLIWSVCLSKITFEVKNDSEFQNRKRRNKESRKRFENAVSYKHMLEHIIIYWLCQVPDNELNHC